MKTRSKKPAFALILTLTLVILLSAVAHARPFTNAFKGGLAEINNFFESGYAPYTKAIDFFFFSLLFIAIYLMGVRYAFKEVKRPEQAIAILLGFMTAFLLVLGGFSVTILLPYIHWVLYALVFILYGWLLKGIKSRLWRFVLALLLTLLTIGFIQGLFGTLAAPDTQGFFSSFGGAFRGIELPGVSAPGVPDYLKGMFEPKAVKTPEAEIVAPAARPPEALKEKGFFGRNSWWLMIILIILLSGGGIYGYRKREWIKEKVKGASEKLKKSNLAENIDKFIADKKRLMEEIKRLNEAKNRIIQAGEKRQAILERLKKEDIANLFGDEARKEMKSEKGAFEEFYNIEMELMTKLKELKDVELIIYGSLQQWKINIEKDGFNAPPHMEYIRNLIGHKTTIKEIRQMGIAWLIVICYDFEKREAVLSKELINLMGEDKIEGLVQGKWEEVKQNNNKLASYIGYETGIIRLYLEPKINEQISKMEELKSAVGELKKQKEAEKAREEAKGVVAQPAPEEKVGPLQIVITEPAEGSEFPQKGKLKIKAEIKNYKIPEGTTYKLILFQIKGTLHKEISTLDVKKEDIEFEVETSKLESGTCGIFVRLADVFPRRSQPNLDSNIVTIDIK